MWSEAHPRCVTPSSRIRYRTFSSTPTVALTFTPFGSRRGGRGAKCARNNSYVASSRWICTFFAKGSAVVHVARHSHGAGRLGRSHRRADDPGSVQVQRWNDGHRRDQPLAVLVHDFAHAAAEDEQVRREIELEARQVEVELLG